MTVSPSLQPLPQQAGEPDLEGAVFQVKSFALGTTSIRQQAEC